MLVSELKSIAKSLKIAGYSKMIKAELIIAIGDATYDDATGENDSRNARMIESIEAMVEEAFPPSVADIDAEYRATLVKAPKSFTVRMTNRLDGYAAQSGCDRLTPAQRRRYFKKYNAQYARLSASLKK